MVLPKIEIEVTADPTNAEVGLDRINKALSAAEGAAEQYVQELENIDKAQSAGLITQRAAQNAIKRAERAYEQAAKDAAAYAGATTRVTSATKGAASGFGSLTAAARNNRATIQQASFQLQDIAVQLQSGTSLTTTLAQQLPQLAGAFGAVGAAVGTGLAVGIPLVSTAMVALIGESQELDKNLEDLAESIDLVNSRSNESATSIEELSKEYGGYAESVRDLLSSQRELVRLDAENQLLEVTRQLSEQFGSFREVVDDTGQTLISGYEEVLRRIIRTTDASNDAALELTRALEGLGKAGSPEEQRRALERVRLALVAAVGTTREMNAEQREVYQNLLNAEQAAARLANIQLSRPFELASRFAQTLADRIGEGLDNAGLLGDAVANITFEGAIAGATSLRDRLSEAFQAAASMAETLAAHQAAQTPGGLTLGAGVPTSGDIPGQFIGGVPFSNAPQTPGFIFRPAGGGRSGRRGGGGGGTNPLIAELESVREALATEQELIQEAHQSQLETIQNAYDQRLLSQQEFQSLSERSAQEHADALAEIERTKQAAIRQDIAGAFGDLASLMQSENNKLFAIGKAAAIAEATVSGYQAAVSAWEKGMEIGGPPVAAAFTAASLARTGALISSIASQSVGGGGGGSAGGGAAPTTGGEGAGPTGASDGPLDVRLESIDPNAAFSGGSLQVLFDRLQDEAGDRGVRFLGNPVQ